MAAQKMKTIVWSSVPDEIVYEILLRLPVKSVCRFRCVSKSWFSFISDPKFTSLHFDHSLANPRMLLISLPTIYNCVDKSRELVCTVDYAEWGNRKWRSQPQSLVADYHGIIPHDHMLSRLCNSVGGLCLAEYWDKNSLLIYNPSTRESIRFKLPDCPIDDIGFCHNKSYLGFDPVEKNHKVLSEWVHLRPPYECWDFVITLGEDAWRSVECKYSHNYFHSDTIDICINGAIYYLSEDASSQYILVGFDVRLEKFTLISTHLRSSPVKREPFLMECGGCVLVVVYKYDKDAHREIVMAMLTDDEKWEYFVPRELLPYFWKNYLKGSTPDGHELVFVSSDKSNLIKLDCYDPETKHMKKIKVRAPKDRKHIWSDFDCVNVCPHVERLQSLQGLSPAFYRYRRY